MKRFPDLAFGALLLMLSLGAACGDQPSAPDPKSAPRSAPTQTLSSFDPPTTRGDVLPSHSIKFQQIDLGPILDIYGEISHRSIIRAGNLPDIKVTFSNLTPLTPVEALQALDTILAAQGIAMVCLGTQYIKAVPASEAHSEPGPVVELPLEQLPDSSSYLVYIIKVGNMTPGRIAPALAPFSKLPNSIITIGPENSRRPRATAGPAESTDAAGTKAVKDETIVILRDYSSNVRRMLQVLEKMK